MEFSNNRRCRYTSLRMHRSTIVSMCICEPPLSNFDQNFFLFFSRESLQEPSPHREHTKFKLPSLADVDVYQERHWLLVLHFINLVLSEYVMTHFSEYSTSREINFFFLGRKRNLTNPLVYLQTKNCPLYGMVIAFAR